eukprot:scaffold7392_cov388-Prasinococcus_capsulatus_cf.AAC.2
MTARIAVSAPLFFLLACWGPQLPIAEAATAHVRQDSVSPDSCRNLGCDYDCSQEYDITLNGSAITLTPTTQPPSGCTCLTGTGVVSGDVGTGGFPDGTTFVARGNGGSIDVVVGGGCTGTYRVTSGQLFGVQATSDASNTILGIEPASANLPLLGVFALTSCDLSPGLLNYHHLTLAGH